MKHINASMILGIMTGLTLTYSAFAQPAAPSAPPPTQSPTANAPAMGTSPAAPVSGLPSLPSAGALPAALPMPPSTVKQETSAPPSALPALPSSPALGNSAVANDASNPTEEAPKKFSYGNSNLSILFLPNQVERLRQSIRTFEMTSKDPKPTTFVAPTPVIEAPVEKVNEPATYPVFYLSSIVYNSPNDWALWIGGQKITAHKNDTDVAVVNVSPDVATFSWQPSYKDAISRRLTADNFAPIDPVKNKIAAIQSIRQDENGMVTFSLRQNQTFAVGYFKTFEGYVDSPKLEPISNANTSSANAMTTMINEVAGSIGALGSAPKPNVPNISNFINRLEGPTKALTAPSRPNPNTAPPAVTPPPVFSPPPLSPPSVGQAGSQ